MWKTEQWNYKKTKDEQVNDFLQGLEKGLSLMKLAIKKKPKQIGEFERVKRAKLNTKKCLPKIGSSSINWKISRKTW